MARQTKILSVEEIKSAKSKEADYVPYKGVKLNRVLCSRYFCHNILSA